MVELIRVIRSRTLTQVAAGKLFEISQPRVSDILRGKIDRFSIDALVDMLALAGLQVQVTTKHFVQGDRSRPHHTFDHGVRVARKPKLP